MLDNNQASNLRAALERAAATLRNAGSGAGLVAPMPFGGPGMFNPMPMAQQGQHPTANSYVANNFPGPTPNQYVGQNFPAGNTGQTPNQYVAQHFMPQAPQAPSPPVQAQNVPMPMARPPQAPQAPQPEMGFFARNAAMMTDPVTGGFIDPSAAAKANNGGLMQKMLGHLFNKADNA